MKTKHGDLFRVYNRDNSHSTCAVYAQKRRYKFVETDAMGGKPIKVAYVNRLFTKVVDVNEGEIDFGLELIGFTDWDSYTNANPCLGLATQKDGVVTYYYDYSKSPITEDEYQELFVKQGIRRFKSSNR